MEIRRRFARRACFTASASVLLVCACSQHQSREGLTTALVKASFECRPRQIEKLVREGADVNAVGHPGGEKPLRMAAVYGRLECVKKLLALGADPLLTGRGAEGEARPSVAAREALVTLEQAMKSSPDQLKANPMLKKAIDRGVNAETYQEILRQLEQAEADRLGQQARK
jgi:ankyrin repeat protein